MRKGRVFVEKLSRGKKQGEDGFPYVADNIVAVADGLGGRGPEQYKDIKTGSIYSSAYIGATTVIEAVQSIPHNQISCDSIKKTIIERLERAQKNYVKISNGISSSMFRIFPTTLALGCIDDNNILHAFWCGDSRVYVWNPQNGLIQISKDDLIDDALDPLSNIYEGGQMSQYVSLSSDFDINESSYQLETENSIVFAASDGAFDYFRSPMHFEMFLLNKMQESASFEEFLFNVKCALEENSGDDVSMAVLFVGSDSYASWKFGIRERFKVLKQNLDVVDEKEKQLDENNNRLEEIRKEIQQISGNIISMATPGIIGRIFDMNMQSEQDKELREILPKTLMCKIDDHISEKHRYESIKSEVEGALLLNLAKDLLGRDSANMGIWTTEYKYRQLIIEKQKILARVERIGERVGELAKELYEQYHIISGELVQGKSISVEYVEKIKSISNELISHLAQVVVLGKLSKRKAKCEADINKICQGVVDKNREYFRGFIYDQRTLTFDISEITTTLFGKMQQIRTKINALDENEQNIKREIVEYLSSVSSLETIKALLGDVDMSKFYELKEKEGLHVSQRSIYEKEIEIELKNIWARYRKTYEFYNHEKCA